MTAETERDRGETKVSGQIQTMDVASNLKFAPFYH